MGRSSGEERSEVLAIGNNMAVTLANSQQLWRPAPASQHSRWVRKGFVRQPHPMLRSHWQFMAVMEEESFFFGGVVIGCLLPSGYIYTHTHEYIALLKLGVFFFKRT